MTGAGITVECNKVSFVGESKISGKKKRNLSHSYLKAGEKACANVVSLEVAGILVAKIDSSIAAKAHKWEFGKSTGTRLTVGGEEATFTGTGEFTLKSGKEWGDI